MIDAIVHHGPHVAAGIILVALWLGMRWLTTRIGEALLADAGEAGE